MPRGRRGSVNTDGRVPPRLWFSHVVHTHTLILSAVRIHEPRGGGGGRRSLGNISVCRSRVIIAAATNSALYEYARKY